MIDGAARLYAAIMPAPDNLPLMDQNRTDGYATLSEALPGLFNGGFEKRIFGHGKTDFCPVL